MHQEQGQFTGKTIDNYRVGPLLGRGGHGEAYKADLIISSNLYQNHSDTDWMK